MTHVVYWIRQTTHTDPKTEGYIGVSKDFDTRQKLHWFHARKPRLHVHKAMAKYGTNGISTSVVTEGDEEYCYAVENLLRPSPNMGWNSAVGGDVATSSTGRVTSQTTRDKIRHQATGRVKSEAAKAAQSAAMSGRNLWENSAARKDVWALAQTFYEWAKNNPGRSAKIMAREHHLPNCNPWKLLDKLRQGWVPAEDAEYMTWLGQLKET